MANILDILTRAQALRQETALNSITPDRAGGIMYDTLILINQMQLEGGSLLISKVYASVSAMEADTTPTSDLTGRALKPGQLVVIVTSDTSSSDMGSEYRYNGPGSWTYVGKVGGLPLDTVPTQSSTKGITSGGVYAALSAMKAEGYKYMGIATPGSGGTAPGTPNQPVFYIAGPGSYPNFGSITVASGYLGFIKYSSGSWTVESVAVGKDYDAQISALDGQISQLEAKVDYEAEEGEDITLGAYFPSDNIYGFGINSDGTTNTTGRASRPIPVKEGDVVQLYKIATTGNEAYIFSTDENATSYTLVATALASQQTISYTVPADGYIAVSIKTYGYDFRIKITRDYASVIRTADNVVEPTYTPSVYILGVDTNDGNLGGTGASSNYKHSDYVDVGGFNYIELSVPYITAKSVAGIAFYDASRVAVGGLAFSGHNASFASNDVALQNIIIPAGVKYVRFTLFADMSGYTQQFSLTGYTINKAYGDGLVQKVQKLQDDLDSDVENLQSQIDDLDSDVEMLGTRGMARFSESLELGEDIYIIAARDNNLLRYGTENGVDYLYLSKDLGTTWAKKQNTYGGLTYAYFFTDGTLMFCSEQAVYHTKDMVTVEQATVYDYDGSTSVPSGHRFFSHTVADKPTYINGVEWVLFYDYVLGTTPNPRIWYSNDNGQTVHAAFAFGLSTINGVAISARHPHGFKYNEHDGYFYAWTGDSESECRIMRGTYSSGVWSWEVLKTGVEYKLGKMWFDAGNFYAVTDFTDGSMADEKGFLKCPISDIDSDNYYHLFRATAQTMGNGSLTNYFADRHGWRVILPDNKGGNRTWVAKDDFAFVEKANSRAIRLNAFFGPDAAGNIYCRYATYGATVTENDLYITSPTVNLTHAMRDSGAVDFMDYNDYDFN